jgi:hypothetical protein
MISENQPQQYCGSNRTNRTLASHPRHNAATDADVDAEIIAIQTMPAPVLALVSTTPAIDRETIALEMDAQRDASLVPTPILAGELMEIEGPALSLFRFATAQERPVIIDIPRDLCSPTVRGRLYDLLVAVEREETTRDDRAAAGPAVALLRDA